jgi:hypothetical protein
MSEAAIEVEPDSLSYGQRMLPLEIAAQSLVITPRHLTELLLKHGFSIYHFGPKSKRVAQEDLQSLLKIISSTAP